MPKKNIAFLEVPLSILILESVFEEQIKNLVIDKINILFSIPSSDELARVKSKYFNSSPFEIYKKRNFSWLFRHIFRSYIHKLENIFVCDIGIYNKLLIIFIRSKNIFILDDGLASVMRKRSITNFIIYFAKIFGKNIFYLSMFKKSFPSQSGKFNINFRQTTIKNTYKNKCFYICSNPTSDGMSIDDEDALIKKILSFSIQNNKELVILPHRRNEHKKNDNYKYIKYVFNKSNTFEEFYTESKFQNCFFMTLYSSAIFAVGDDQPKYILKDFFKADIPSYNFFLRVFGVSVDVNNVINYMEDNLKNIIILSPQDI
tara:strand:- start:14321 stop:15268 length:948 start_codon:yes stop_codon:yes gene_type:complete